MKSFRIFAILAAVLKAQRLGVIQVEGNSMTPTFKAGSNVIIANISPGDKKRDRQLNNLEIGDVVVIDRESQLMLKRIKRIQVGKHTDQLMIWVEGDNPIESVDSRQWGPIPIELVKAVVI